MRRRELLLLPDERPGGPVRWALRRAGRVEATGAGGWAEAAAAAGRGATALLLVPAEAVLLASVELPPGRGQVLRQAAAYAVEGMLATDVERCHVVAGARAADGTTPVAVVERARLEAWIEAAATAGLAPAAAVPEPLALPLEEGCATVAVDGARAVVRTGPAAGFGGEAANLAALLARAGVHAAVLHRCGAAPALAGVELHERPCPEQGHLALLAAHGPPARRAPLDLLAGLERGAALSRRASGAVAAAAVAGLVAALLLVGGDAAALWRARAGLAAAEARVARALAEGFPEIRRVVAPRAQVRQVLARLRGGGGVAVDLLARAGRAAREAPAGSVRAARYEAGTLTLEIEAPSLEAVERLAEAVRREGARAEVTGLSREGGLVRAQLTVRPADGGAGA